MAIQMEIEIEDNEFELNRLTGNETEQHKGRNCCRIVNSKQIREKKEQCSAIYQTCWFSPKQRHKTEAMHGYVIG